MNYFFKVTILITVCQYEGINSKPLSKLVTVSKNFHFELKPFKTLSFLLENPFGKFEWKHSIEKRETPDVSPTINEIPGPQVPNGEVLKITPIHTVVVPEFTLVPPVKPIENGNPYSFLIPWSPEIVSPPNPEPPPSAPQPLPAPPHITPQTTRVEVISNIIPIIEITPKPVEVAPVPVTPVPVTPVPVTPVPVNVVLNTPGEAVAPPVQQPPVFLTEEVPKTPVMYTDITKIPMFSFTSVYSPAPIPIVQEAIPVITTPVPPPPSPPPPPPPPPPPVEEPPVVVKEPPPNYIVKGSRLILFFGSKILQMLSQFIEEGASRITLPNFTLEK